MAKTTEEIAADCEITDADELHHLDRALAGGSEYSDLSALELDFIHVIVALYRRIESLESSLRAYQDQLSQEEDDS